MVKLHVGCGSRYLPTYVHVDVQEYDHVDVVVSMLRLNEVFDSESVDEIYACHVLEHVSRHDVEQVLQNFKAILKPNGVLRIAVPDVEQVAKLYWQKQASLSTLTGLLWGGQRSEFDIHKCGFDFDTLSSALGKVGFRLIQRYDWRDFLPSNFDDYSRAYIPHMDMDNGTLVSLNIMCLS